MITIFCDFCQFSAKKLCVFLKNQCYAQIFAKNSSSLSKKAIFHRKIRRKYLKNHNICPWSRLPDIRFGGEDEITDRLWRHPLGRKLGFAVRLLEMIS
jgi:hypothetical protein